MHPKEKKQKKKNLEDPKYVRHRNEKKKMSMKLDCGIIHPLYFHSEYSEYSILYLYLITVNFFFFVRCFSTSGALLWQLLKIKSTARGANIVEKH